MGLIYAEIELINGEDLALARRYYIGEDEIIAITNYFAFSATL